MTMYLWLLTRYDDTDPDEYRGFVIAATTSSKARVLADRHVHDPSSGRMAPRYGWVWSDPGLSRCKRIGEARQGTEPGVILDSYNAR